MNSPAKKRIRTGFRHFCLYLFAISLCVCAPLANAAKCGAALEVPGKMPRNPNYLSFQNFETTQWGMLTQSSFDFHKLPPAFLVNVTSGRQDFAFKFSDNITRIRLSIGSEFLYEGKPIKSFDAGKKPSGELKIEFEWDGVDARVEVNDNCALVDTYDFGQRKQ